MAKKTKPEAPFNNPFGALRAELEAKVAKAPAAAPPPPPEPEPEPEPEPPDDAALFLAAVGNARPLRDPRGVALPEPPPGHAEGVRIHDEDQEALEELTALVDGSKGFDIEDTDEYIEGCVPGFDRQRLRKLRRGDFSHQSHLDLHGLTRDVAKVEVERFIEQARRQGQRCVLIVHGRGLNSKDQIPVLKGLLKVWLERGRIARAVLAFATARPHDGGAGAVYVLLRR